MTTKEQATDTANEHTEFGFKSNSNEFSKSSRTFGDGKKRRKNGQYGFDKSYKSQTKAKGFFSYATDLKIGEYNFGTFKVDVSPSNIGFSLGKKSEDIVVNKVDKKLTQLTKDMGFDPEIVDSLKNYLAKIGCNIDSIMVKEIAIEGPGAKVEAKLGEKVGAGASAQAGALRLTLDSPIADLIVKLKRGVGIGGELGLAQTKKGKIGIAKEGKINFGVWEANFRLKEQQAKPEQKTESNNQQTLTEKEFIKSQKRATEFVSKQQSKSSTQHATSTNSTTRSSDIAQNELLDETVDQIAEQFKDDATVTQLHANYKDENNRAKGFVTFKQKLGDHLNSQNKLDAYVKAGTQASFFLSEVASLTKDRNLRRFATGLGSVTQIFSGFKDVSGAINAISTATTLTASTVLTTAASFMGGAGLVLGGLSALSTLLDSGNDSDQMGEALNTINENIMKMWSEMHESFELTWERLDVIENKMDIIEQNNWQRFKYTMEAIEYSYQDINAKLNKLNENVIQSFSDLKDFLKTYLDHIVDRDAKITISAIERTESPDELLNRFIDYTPILSSWLIDSVALTARTGQLERSHNTFSNTKEMLIKKLRDVIAPERLKERALFNYPLGLFASFAKDIQPNIFSQIENLTIINPQDWFYVFNAYEKLIRVGKDKILRAPKKVQETYLREIDRIEQVIDSTLKFFETITQSKYLWEKLISNYQNKFNEIKLTTESKSKEINKPILPREMQLTLLESAEQNMHRLEGIPNHAALVHQITASVSWLDLKGNRQDELCDEKCYGNLHQVPNGELEFIFDKPKYEKISTLSQGDFEKKITQIKSNIRFAISFVYKLAQPSVAYAPRRIGDDIYGWDFSVFIYPSISFNEKHYPFTQINLFRDVQTAPIKSFNLNELPKEPYTGFHNANKYNRINAVKIFDDKRFYSKFYIRQEFEDNISVLIDIFEKNILIPARKSIIQTIIEPKPIIEKITDNEKINILITDLELAYLKIVSFVQLIEPTFKVKKISDAIHRLKSKIQELVKTSSAEALVDLYRSVQGNKLGAVWQEELWSYMGENLRNFSSEDLRERLKKNLSNHPLYKAMTEAKEKIDKLQADLDLSLNSQLCSASIKTASSKIREQQKLLDESIAVLANSLSITTEIKATAPLVVLEENFFGYEERANDIKNTLDFMDFDEVIFNKGSENDKEQQSTNSTWFEDNKSKKENYETTLQQLCSDSNANLKNIETEIIKLQANNQLEKILNKGEIYNRPLYLAMHIGRVDVVALLLEYDAKVELHSVNELLNNYSNNELANQMHALINFFVYIHQQSLEENFSISQTLGLIRNAINNLLPFVNLEDANIVIGKTGVGKSSLVNNILGVDYQLEELDDGRLYLQPTNNKKEPAQTSLLSRSETAYPQILNIENVNIVDMPGFRDTRGLPWEITAGLSVQLLSRSFNSVRSLIFVCADGDLFDAKIEGIRDSLYSLGKIINQNPALIPNVLIVVNKATGRHVNGGAKLIKKRLDAILKENPDFPETTKFILNNLTKENILVTEILDSKLRETILSHIKNMKSHSIDDYNFLSYHLEAEKFKKLLSRLTTYQQQITNEINGLATNVYVAQQEVLKKTILDLNAKVFDSTVDKTSCTIDHLEKATLLQDGLFEQQQLQQSLSHSIEELTKQIVQLNPHVPLSTVLSTPDILSEIMLKKAQLTVVDNFLEQIKPVIEHLKLEEFGLTEKKDSEFACDGEQNCHTATEDKINQFARDNGECEKNLAWPLPGGCAASIPDFGDAANKNSEQPMNWEFWKKITELKNWLMDNSTLDQQTHTSAPEQAFDHQQEESKEEVQQASNYSFTDYLRSWFGVPQSTLKEAIESSMRFPHELTELNNQTYADKIDRLTNECSSLTDKLIIGTYVTGTTKKVWGWLSPAYGSHEITNAEHQQLNEYQNELMQLQQWLDSLDDSYLKNEVKWFDELLTAVEGYLNAAHGLIQVAFETKRFSTEINHDIQTYIERLQKIRFKLIVHEGTLQQIFAEIENVATHNSQNKQQQLVEVHYTADEKLTWKVKQAIVTEINPPTNQWLTNVSKKLFGQQQKFWPSPLLGVNDTVCIAQQPAEQNTKRLGK